MIKDLVGVLYQQGAHYSSSSNMGRNKQLGNKQRLRKILDGFAKKSKIIWLFCKFVCEAIVLPIVSSCLTFWNEATDFIVAYHAIKDGEVVLGLFIGMIPFLPFFFHVHEKVQWTINSECQSL